MLVLFIVLALFVSVKTFVDMKNSIVKSQETVSNAVRDYTTYKQVERFEKQHLENTPIIFRSEYETEKYRGSYIHKVKDMESNMQYVIVFPDGQAFYSESIELAKALINERIILKAIEKIEKKE